MTLASLIPEINYNLKGTDDTSPVLGDDDWNHWVVVANRKKNEMYDDVDKDWASAYAERLIGTIIAGTTPAFNLNNSNSDFIAPAKEAYVVRTDGNRSWYDIVKPQDTYYSTQAMYIYSQNPMILKFVRDILAGDQNINGTLYLPGYWRPADIDGTLTTSYIPVDDPHWLAMAVAAEVAFNDITYQDKYVDLNGKANALWKQMTRKNRRTARGSARTSRTEMHGRERIRGFRR